MPYKYNESRRHHFNKAKYKIQNWHDYNQSAEFYLAVRQSLIMNFNCMKFIKNTEETAAMKNYTHLLLRDRKRIHYLLARGYTIQEIANRLGRHRSTIYRELCRNGSPRGYSAYDADHKAHGRYQYRGSKISYDRPLYHYVLRRLKQGWSPEQIAGRMKRQNKRYYACHETIYRYLYSQRNKGLYYLLARKKPKRGKRYGRKVGSDKFAGIRLISALPQEVKSRQTIGHWEGDTIGFAVSKYENITTLVERKSRFVCLHKNATRQSVPVMSAISNLIGEMPKQLWKSLILDQGSEFAYYRLIENQRRCVVYYCNPHSPWQRGSNENMNGRIRRYLPRQSAVQDITQKSLDRLSKKLNNTPRKCLGFMTPKEVLKQHCRSFTVAL